jgi:hypothetical protein
MTLSEPLEVTTILARVFDELGIQYLVGGSLASSIHGIPRATQDVDVVADIKLKQVKSMVSKLEDEFYIDEDMIKDAIRHRKSFNIIYLATMFKIDVFVFQGTLRSQDEMARREAYQIPGTEHKLQIASAEDMVIEKLRWYELGQRISDRQWKDVQGILEVKKGSLNLDYLRDYADELNLSELLKKAFEEADYE